MRRRDGVLLVSICLSIYVVYSGAGDTLKKVFEDPQFQKGVSNVLNYTLETLNGGIKTTRTINAPLGAYRMTLKADKITSEQKRLSLEFPYGVPLGMNKAAQEEYIENTNKEYFGTNSLLPNKAETSFVEKRMKHIKAKIGKGTKVPKVAICLSGGGDRAKLAAAGALKGAEETGLIDKVLYISGLSGGTWTMAPRSLGIPLDALIATWKKYSKFPVGVDLIKSITKYPYLKPSLLPNEHCVFPEKTIIANNLRRKFYFSQQIDSIDLWGSFIAHLNLGAVDDPELIEQFNPGHKVYPYQSRQRLLFSQAAEYIMRDDCASYPMPIGTAVTHLNPQDLLARRAVKRQKLTSSNMLWFEFTPWRVGTRYIGQGMKKKGAFIPLPAFNRKFKREKRRLLTVDNAPEVPLGNLMGTWGSAYTVSLSDVLRILDLKEDPKQEILDKVVTAFKSKGVMDLLKDLRILPSTYFNFAHPSFMPDSPLTDKFLELVDAGIDFNLPFPPLLEREVDVIIVVDASAHPIKEKDGKLIVGEFLKSALWARTNNLPFPKITKTAEYENIPNKAVTIFKGKGAIPTVIYIPLSDPKNDPKFKEAVGDFTVASCFEDGHCNTVNFNYSEKNIDGIVNFMNQAIKTYKDEIDQAIVEKAL